MLNKKADTAMVFSYLFLRKADKEAAATPNDSSSAAVTWHGSSPRVLLLCGLSGPSD